MNKVAPKPQVHIFTQRIELYFLGLFLLGLVTTGFESIFFKTFNLGSIKLIMRLVSDVVFLGTIHAIISYSLLLFIPEVREWVVLRTKGRPHLYWLENFFFVLLICVGILLAITAGAAGLGKQIFSWMLIVYFLFDIFGTRHHIMQFQGLSLLYNQQLRISYNLTLEQQQRSRKLEHWEKWAFQGLVFSACISQFGAFAVFLQHINIPYYPILFSGITMSLFFCLLILGISFLMPYSQNSYKGLFLLRILFLPFRSISFSANVFLRCFHGAEFLLLMGNVLDNTRASHKIKRHFVIFSIFGVMFAGICTLAKRDLLGNYFYSRPSDHPIFVILVTLNTVFNFIHYLMDAQMFKFKNIENRKTIGPLLPYKKAPDTFL